MSRARILGSPVLLGLAFPAGSVWGGGPAGGATGDVFVQSTGGAIVLDGVDIGVRAPGVIAAVPVGEHTVRVVDGCRVGEVRVSVQADLVERVEVTLAEGTGTLRVLGPAPEARILVDGVEAGRAAQGDLTLACGDHRVTLEAEGYHPRKARVEVALGQTVEIEGGLLPLDMAEPVPTFKTAPKVQWLNVGIDTLLIGATVGLAVGARSSWSRMNESYDAYAAMDYQDDTEGFYTEQVRKPGRMAQVLGYSALGAGLGATATIVFLPIRKKGE